MVIKTLIIINGILTNRIKYDLANYACYQWRIKSQKMKNVTNYDRFGDIIVQASITKDEFFYYRL